MLTGAIVGAIAGALAVIIMGLLKQSKYKALLKSLAGKNLEYSINAYYTTAQRYGKSVKVFDASGAFYISGHMACFFAGKNMPEQCFDLRVCTVTKEPNWRKLQWFSITTPAGEKNYFTSYKTGLAAADSSEVATALDKLQQKQAALKS